jgi:hypothetical protein
MVLVRKLEDSGYMEEQLGEVIIVFFTERL